MTTPDSTGRFVQRRETRVRADRHADWNGWCSVILGSLSHRDTARRWDFIETRIRTGRLSFENLGNRGGSGGRGRMTTVAYLVPV